MDTKKKQKIGKLLALLAVVLALAAHYLFSPWGFYRKTAPEEAALRQKVVAQAESYLGLNEADGSYLTILDVYNAHAPLAQGYVVQPEDSWCATFVSTVAIACDVTDILPTECGCQRQIALFQSLGRWEEDDTYVPQPGDIIYYDWQDKGLGDCTGWADHVGLVVGVKWPFAKVIEGNKDDCVCYRYILLGGLHIRGYGLPDYASAAKKS